MIDFHKTEFARVGGNETWLEGLSKVPQKIRSLDALNRILAHQPWLLQTSHLQVTVQIGLDEWSTSQPDAFFLGAVAGPDSEKLVAKRVASSSSKSSFFFQF